MQNDQAKSSLDSALNSPNLNSQGWICDLLAPLDGPVMAIEDVPDPVFAQKIVGPGVAIEPTGDTLKAPCAGKVVQLHRAHHAVTIEHESGIQILLHIGLDTVKLGGEGFFPQVKIGDIVRAGQNLIRFDADFVSLKAKSLLSVMIVTDTSEDRLQFPFAVFSHGSRISNGSSRGECLPQAFAGADILLRFKTQQEPGSKGQSASPTHQAYSPVILIRNLTTGLHARPAALLAAMAKPYNATIFLYKGTQSANAKSVVSIMGLDVGLNDQIHFQATGADSEQAVRALYDFLHGLREQTPEHSGAKSPATASRSTDPNVLSGIGVSPGMAIGKIHLLQTEHFHYSESTKLSPEKEEGLFQQALATAAADLRNLMDKVLAKTDVAIFAAHLELLDDPDILCEAHRFLLTGKSAAYSWDQAITASSDRLARLNNELMANRANDLRDVGRRVLRILLEKNTTNPPIEAGSILVAESLSPSETVQLDRSKVLGFCTTTGGSTSHVAILARSLGIPAIAGIDAKALTLTSGLEVVLDGESGELRLKPTSEDRARTERVQNEQFARRQAALKLAHQAALTSDHHLVEVAANIGSVADAHQAIAMGGDGVGLLRSEFLFLERETAPTEDEQLQVYQEIADILGSRTFVIRTLDVGGDKPLRYLPMAPEENPFLGVRGIRVGFEFPEILRTQLRAILRVKSHGKLCVMFPMIATVEEFRQAKAMLTEERERLGVQTSLEVGIMVEVPSAALNADDLAAEADFFSVGTNDLTQYTLAMDRGHTGLARQVDALHPAVLKLIQMSAQAAHRHGKWIGVCGGLASDLKAIETLIGLGIDELSVSIPSIPLVKAAVRATSLHEAQKLACLVVKSENAFAVRKLLAEQKTSNKGN
jgi:phosphocarrier protein FPr